MCPFYYVFKTTTYFYPILTESSNQSTYPYWINESIKQMLNFEYASNLLKNYQILTSKYKTCTKLPNSRIT